MRNRLLKLSIGLQKLGLKYESSIIYRKITADDIKEKLEKLWNEIDPETQSLKYRRENWVMNNLYSEDAWGSFLRDSVGELAGRPSAENFSPEEHILFDVLQEARKGPPLTNTKGGYSDDVEFFILNNQLHRVDGPAVIEPSGREEWWLNGKRHREGGPALTTPDGYEAWYMNGEHHRVGGPAITNRDSYEAWFINGEYHREDGPAVRFRSTEYWYLHDKGISEEEWREKTGN